MYTGASAAAPPASNLSRPALRFSLQRRPARHPRPRDRGGGVPAAAGTGTLAGISSRTGPEPARAHSSVVEHPPYLGAQAALSSVQVPEFLLVEAAPDAELVGRCRVAEALVTTEQAAQTRRAPVPGSPWDGAFSSARRTWLMVVPGCATAEPDGMPSVTARQVTAPVSMSPGFGRAEPARAQQACWVADVGSPGDVLAARLPDGTVHHPRRRPDRSAASARSPGAAAGPGPLPAQHWGRPAHDGQRPPA